MIAQLWHDKIVAGEKKFHETPNRLKDAVRQLLIESGHEELIDE